MSKRIEKEKKISLLIIPLANILYALLVWRAIESLPYPELKGLFFCVFFALGIFLKVEILILSSLGGFLFGSLAATAYGLIALAFMIVFCFASVRRLGSQVTEKFRHKDYKFYIFSREPILNAFIWAFRNRMLPIIPFDDFTWGAGYTRIRLLPYLSGSLLGLFFVVLIYSDLAATFSLKISEGLGIFQTIRLGIDVLLAVVLLFIPILYRHVRDWGSEQ
jgi:uncharacterized membrane protein YdjX (TVP38/TMEM64 family)